ncbi:MAG: HipA domain-containing protein [Gammaproteobacteria bacterium]|jgi:serine/threonine-protein kinase HipA
MNNIKYAFCPISYEPIEEGSKYSKKGLKSLSPRLNNLNDLPFSAEEQRKQARARADKMSIQGVQPKFSAILNIKKNCFEICDVGGMYILKPQSEYFAELPENEDLSMHIAATLDIEVPLHGLIYSIDGSFSYFIKRFDRAARGQKLAVEDFSQLAGLTRDTKYNFSMEKIIPIIEQHCTFPVVEKKQFFIRTLFNYIIGNEDMHLKNFSLIYRDNKIELAPAYDFINTTIAMGVEVKEEIALPLNGKKHNLKKQDLIQYYGMEKLGLNESIINEILKKITLVIPKWESLIKISFLSKTGKDNYLRVVDQRIKILDK